MTSSPTRIVRTLRQAPVSSRARKRRDDSGLTTLEWLLIVAAVAGLAALAVVLVQNVVSDTSEQIAGSSARQTAAKVAALAVEDESKAYDSNLDQFAAWTAWDNYFTSKCNRIEITYSDAGISVTATFAEPATANTTLNSTSLATAANPAPSATVATVGCAVT